jgi:8-oxo-dGTP pyrophosphatase MutT (NUDIX family)
MYKVFFNDHQLLWGPEFNNSFNDNIDQITDIESFDGFIQLLLKLDAEKHVVKLIIVSKQHPDLMALLKDKLTRIPAAGGLAVDKEGRFLFVKRFGKWDLPKGKIEADESPEMAAVREVEEECGVSGLTIECRLPSTFHLYRSPYILHENNWVLKETSWFEMSYAGSGELAPQTEEQIEEVRWVSKEELPDVYSQTYGNIKDLLRPYLD